MNALAVTAERLMLAKVDPDINPTTKAPWLKNFLNEFTGQIIGTMVVLLILALAVAVALAVFGKIFQSHGLMIGGLVGGASVIVAAMVLGSATALVMNFYGIHLF